MSHQTSRKFTQFHQILPSTGVGYVNEAASKYAPGTRIGGTPQNHPSIRGRELQGRLYLEVPVQTGPIPQRVIDAANARKVIIRDTNGSEYN
jgi:hypothetical protein